MVKVRGQSSTTANGFYLPPRILLMLSGADPPSLWSSHNLCPNHGKTWVFLALNFLWIKFTQTWFILFFSKTSSVCWNSRHHVRTINVSLYVVTHKLNGNEMTLKVKHHSFHVQLVGLWRRSQLDPLSLPSARSRAKGSGDASSALNDSCTSESETLNCIHLNI